MIWSASFVPLLALGVSAAPSPTAPKPVTIPLTRRQALAKREHDPAWAKSQADWLKYKWGGGGSSKRASGVNDLVNKGTDSSYYGSIAVGTPPVAFNVILDTGKHPLLAMRHVLTSHSGSSDLWLASSTCYTGCRGVPTFDASRSTSFKK
jgi:cathepsin D